MALENTCVTRQTPRVVLRQYKKSVGPRTAHRFPLDDLDLPRQIGRLIPDRYDLRCLFVPGVSRISCILYSSSAGFLGRTCANVRRSCTACRNGRVGSG